MVVTGEVTVADLQLRGASGTIAITDMDQADFTAVEPAVVLAPGCMAMANHESEDLSPEGVLIVLGE